MSGLEKRWFKQPKESVSDKLKDAIRPKENLRNQVSSAQRSVQVLVTRLDSKSTRLQEQDAKLFQSVVSAMQAHETERASAYSNELAEVRKITRSITQIKLVLEQINLRMGTVQDFGDVVTSISPVVSVVKGMRGSLQGIMPEAGSEMSDIGDMLSGMITDAGQLGGTFNKVSSSSDESEKILAEASALVELKHEDKFPVPIPTEETESTEYTQ